MSRYFGRVLRREWTDKALIMGPNVRWTEDDYQVLNHVYPEVFLGYQVHFATPEHVVKGRMWGNHFVKAVFLDGLITEAKPGWSYAFRDIALRCDHIEWWHVHRGEGIWRVQR